MAGNVVTVPDAYADQLATLLAIGRQKIPVEVVPSSTYIQSWSQVLSVDNRSLGWSPALSAGDRLQFGAPVADAEIYYSGGSFRVDIASGSFVLNTALAWTPSAYPAIFQTGTNGRQLSITAQEGTTTGGALWLRAGNGGTIGGSIYMAPGADSGGTPGVVEIEDAGGFPLLRVSTTGVAFFSGGLRRSPSVTGSRGGNAALASLLTELDAMGLITDNTTA